MSQWVSVCAKQILTHLLRCLLPVALISLAVGAMFAIQAYALVNTFDIQRYLPIGLAPILVREIAPGFTCLIIAMLVGTSLSAEIATMRASQEIETFWAIGVSPPVWILGTRIVAVSVLAPLLNALALACCTLGAYWIAVTLNHLPSTLFFSGLFHSFSVHDLYLSQSKCLFLGFLMGVISALFGYFSKTHVDGIRQAINRSVNLSITLVFTLNYLLDQILC